MVYANLKAEMTRKGLTTLEVAKVVGISERAMRNKLNGVTDFSWKQVCKIQSEIFPQLSKEYLFNQEIQ